MGAAEELLEEMPTNSSFCDKVSASAEEKRCTGQFLIGRESHNHRHIRRYFDWTQLIVKIEKRYTCLVCQQVYQGRTEAVFHVVTRHMIKVLW